MVTAYDDLILQTAAHYRLPADLLKSQVIRESSGLADAFRFEPHYYAKYIQHHPQAKGFAYGPLAACSYGLLQILLETALEIGFDGHPWDLFIPRIGLSWGAKKLREIWDGLGGLDSQYHAALARYNGAGAAAHAYADAVYVTAGRSLDV